MEKICILIVAGTPVEDYNQNKKDITRVIKSVSIDESVEASSTKIPVLEENTKNALKDLMEIKSIKAEKHPDPQIGRYKITIQGKSKVAVNKDVQGAVELESFIKTIQEKAPGVPANVSEYYFVFTDDKDQTLFLVSWMGGRTSEEAIFKDANEVEIGRFTYQNREEFKKKKEAEEAAAKKVAEEKAFKAEAKAVSYKDISRDPDSFKGTKAMFEGKVIQVVEGTTGNVLRVNVNKGKYNIWEDTVYVTYDKSLVSVRVLEDDIVQIFGTLDGLQSYETVLGGKMTIPKLEAKYITIK